jgi:hypothetical protein
MYSVKALLSLVDSGSNRKLRPGWLLLPAYRSFAQTVQLLLNVFREGSKSASNVTASQNATSVRRFRLFASSGRWPDRYRSINRFPRFKHAWHGSRRQRDYITAPGELRLCRWRCFRDQRLGLHGVIGPKWQSFRQDCLTLKKSLTSSDVYGTIDIDIFLSGTT